MTTRLILTLVIAVSLAGCGGMRTSKLNPFNWFGKSEPRETMVLPTQQADPRALVETVLEMKIEAIPGGAIIRATGRSPTQGWWAAELVAGDVDENGRLVIDFRILPPIKPADVSTPQSRDVTAALYLSDIVLAPISEIVVQGASNARASRR